MDAGHIRIFRVWVMALKPDVQAAELFFGQSLGNGVFNGMEVDYGCGDALAENRILVEARPKNLPSAVTRVREKSTARGYDPI